MHLQTANPFSLALSFFAGLDQPSPPSLPFDQSSLSKFTLCIYVMLCIYGAYYMLMGNALWGFQMHVFANCQPFTFIYLDFCSLRQE
ncbi:hypothetical protein CICLE_v10017527mg [Citrus x clementina]|uniref:Uncharacterized protein n=1 Tax=Citrus clementina TaxID=85681 RepID=V4UGK9_CITCL|nr:hypothetical protein CICLE_v10017527mg [Citrus x clementina]